MVITTFGGIEAPHNVQVGRDGQTVYAVSGSNMVVAIDAATYDVRASAPTGGAPAHVIETNDKTYVTNSADGTVSVYRAVELQPIGQITVGGMPHGLRPSADGSVVVVANTMEGALDVIDAATATVLGSVPVGARIQPRWRSRRTGGSRMPESPIRPRWSRWIWTPTW